MPFTLFGSRVGRARPSVRGISCVRPMRRVPIVITFLGFGSNESAPRSSFVDAFMRIVRPSMAEKVPLVKTHDLVAR